MLAAYRVTTRPSAAGGAKGGREVRVGIGLPNTLPGASGELMLEWARRAERAQFASLGYFALGEGAATPGASYLMDYYAFTGPFAEKIAAGNLTSPQLVREFVRGYEEAGCDHLVLLPTVADLAQVERLAEAIA